MSKLPVIELVSHTRRVQTLYKQALRALESWYDRREVYRYQAVLLRQRFEENKTVKDMRVAKELVTNGEEELFQNNHYQVRKFPLSPGGVAYEREVIPSDWMLDFWHPLEKAQYPQYFARREARKKTYVKLWEKTFGKTTAAHH